MPRYRAALKAMSCGAVSSDQELCRLQLCLMSSRIGYTKLTR